MFPTSSISFLQFKNNYLKKIIQVTLRKDHLKLVKILKNGFSFEKFLR